MALHVQLLSRGGECNPPVVEDAGRLQTPERGRNVVA